MSIFSFDNYRAYIRHQIDENRGIRGYQSKLADAAHCQRTYLSQVLHQGINLTPDHAMGLCEYWNLDDNETEYFLTLVEWDRSGRQNLKKYLASKLNEIKTRVATKETFSESHLSESDTKLKYYSTWYWAAIHVLISIPNDWTPAKIAARLELPKDLVAATLQALQSMGLAAHTSKSWKAIQRDLHLPTGSELSGLNHFNWRHRAIIDLQNKPKEGLHYTAVHALSRHDIEKIKILVRGCINEARAIVAPSPEEDLLIMTVDLFQL